MKKLKTLIYSAGLIALLGACSNDNEALNIQNKSKALTFDSNIVPTQTRVTDNKFDKEDAIGVFAYDLENSALKSNAKHLFNDTDNKFIPISGSEITIDGKGEKINITAYYPYQESTADTYNIDLSTTPVDLLYANKIEVADEANPKLIFGHKLACINLKMIIKADDKNEIKDFTDLVLSKTEGIKTSASLNLNSGVLTLGEESKSYNLELKKNEENKEASVDFLILPGQKINDIKLSFTLNGDVYEWIPELKDKKTDVVENTRYTFTASFFKKDNSIVVEPGVDENPINPWDVNEGKDSELNPKEETPEPEASLKVDPSELDFEPAVSSKNITVTASEGLVWNVAVEGNNPWLTAVKEEGSVKVNVEENTTADLRTANLIFSGEGLKDNVIVKVTQDKGAITPEPIEQVIFEDNFDLVTSKSTALSTYTKMLRDNGQLDNHPNFSYNSIGEGKIDVRTAENKSIWFPAANDKNLHMENVNVQGYSKLSISFDLVCQNADKVKASSLSVKVGDKDLDTLEDIMLDGGSDYKTFNLEIGDVDTDEITISFSVGTTPVGIRMDNIILKGFK